MYLIKRVENNEIIAKVEKVNYIKVSDNGCLTNATIADATGLSYHNIPYNLVDNNEIEDADSVYVIEWEEEI